MTTPFSNRQWKLSLPKIPRKASLLYTGHAQLTLAKKSIQLASKTREFFDHINYRVFQQFFFSTFFFSGYLPEKSWRFWLLWPLQIFVAIYIFQHLVAILATLDICAYFLILAFGGDLGYFLTFVAIPRFLWLFWLLFDICGYFHISSFQWRFWLFLTFVAISSFLWSFGLLFEQKINCPKYA